MDPFTLRMVQRARTRKLENANHWIPEKRTKILQAINKDVVPKPGCMEEIYSLHRALLNFNYTVDNSSMEAQDIFTISNKEQNTFSYVEIDMETVAVDCSLSEDYLGSKSSNSSSDSVQEIFQETVKNRDYVGKSEEYHHSSSCESECVKEIFQQTVKNRDYIGKSGEYHPRSSCESERVQEISQQAVKNSDNVGKSGEYHHNSSCESECVQEISQETVKNSDNVSKSGEYHRRSLCKSESVQEIFQQTVENSNDISKSEEYHYSSSCESERVQEISQQTVENSDNVGKSGEYHHSSSCESESSFVKNEICCSVEEKLKVIPNDIYNSPLNECEISQLSYFSCNEPIYEELRDPLESSMVDDASECQNVYYRCPPSATKSAFANHPRTFGIGENVESNFCPETQYVLDRFLEDALGDENVFSSENEESFFSPVPSAEKDDVYQTVSDYRKLLQLSRQKIRSPLSKSSFSVQDDASRSPKNPEEERQKTLEKLFQQIAAQRKILDQTKKARDFCSQSRKLKNSAMIVDCERTILLTCNKIKALMNEIERVNIQEITGVSSREEGLLTVTEIILLLQDEHAKIKAERDSTWYVCVLSHHDTVLATPARSKIQNMKITFQGNYTFSNLSSDFIIDLNVYSYCHKPHSWGSPFRRQTSQRAGFSLEGTTQIGLPNLKNTFWNLKNVPPTSALARILTMTITCSVSSKITVSGFLNYCLETKGPKIWDRKWFVIDGHVLKFWNSPLDQEYKAPEGSIDILSCIDQKIKQTDRSSCARPWTFLIQTGDNKRHFLQADSNWEMTEWCSFLNEVLAIHRAWDIK